jgi:hypothetical protein
LQTPLSGQLDDPQQTPFTQARPDVHWLESVHVTPSPSSGEHAPELQKYPAAQPIEVTGGPTLTVHAVEQVVAAALHAYVLHGFVAKLQPPLLSQPIGSCSVPPAQLVPDAHVVVPPG